MKRFLSSQIASFVSTACDQGIGYLLVLWTLIDPLVCSGLATFAGGCINFTINRQWVFKDRKGKLGADIFRYFVVWVVYFLIVQGIMYFLKHKINNVNNPKQFFYAKLAASIIGAVFNYLMQKTVVFAKKKEIFNDEPI